MLRHSAIRHNFTRFPSKTFLVRSFASEPNNSCKNKDKSNNTKNIDKSIQINIGIPDFKKINWSKYKPNEETFKYIFDMENEKYIAPRLSIGAIISGITTTILLACDNANYCEIIFGSLVGSLIGMGVFYLSPITLPIAGFTLAILPIAYVCKKLFAKENNY